jgi:hypothetical protein
MRGQDSIPSYFTYSSLIVRVKFLTTKLSNKKLKKNNGKTYFNFYMLILLDWIFSLDSNSKDYSCMYVWVFYHFVYEQKKNCIWWIATHKIL